MKRFHINYEKFRKHGLFERRRRVRIQDEVDVNVCYINYYFILFCFISLILLFNIECVFCQLIFLFKILFDPRFVFRSINNCKVDDKFQILCGFLLNKYFEF